MAGGEPPPFEQVGRPAPHRHEVLEACLAGDALRQAPTARSRCASLRTSQTRASREAAQRRRQRRRQARSKLGVSFRNVLFVVITRTCRESIDGSACAAGEDGREFGREASAAVGRVRRDLRHEGRRREGVSGRQG